MTQPIEVWRMSRAGYQAQKGVHRPWIGEISTVQFAGLSKRGKAQYEQKRDREWQASADCALAYARECFEAFERDPSILDSQDMHPDARSAIFSMRQAQRKEAFEQLFALARLQNNLTSTADVELGDRVYSILHGRYVTIIGKHKVSVRVRDDSGDEYKVKIGACQWLHYNELKAAVEAGQPVRLRGNVNQSSV